jgi:CrcB protein
MTTAVTLGLIGLAGGLGAALRLVLDGIIRGRVSTTYPVATTVINLSGSLLLGLLTGLAAGEVLPHPAQLIAGTGFLGGYTTFSTASFETVRLVEDRRYLAATLNGLGVLAAATLLAGLGLLAGLAVTP